MRDLSADEAWELPYWKSPRHAVEVIGQMMAIVGTSIVAEPSWRRETLAETGVASWVGMVFILIPLILAALFWRIRGMDWIEVGLRLVVTSLTAFVFAVIITSLWNYGVVVYVPFFASWDAFWLSEVMVAWMLGIVGGIFASFLEPLLQSRQCPQTHVWNPSKNNCVPRSSSK